MSLVEAQTGTGRIALLGRRACLIAASCAFGLLIAACGRRDADANAEGSPAVISQEELARTYSTLTDLMIEVHSDEIWNKFWAAKDAVDYGR